ncbi:MULTISPECIES: glycosyltransferase family 2 protein [Brevibacillus]|uniref:glycosyltransferase family 2 protein n=1 Tax=Brevibacillus TaxID=55080 RepID=UPI0002405243|nr:MULTISPECIES: glycosyltransferase family 2 protein [Brevibacillus]MBA4533528.1 glycosyltransferase family 2 protein [Brevibacillus halotolerans]MCR8995774.1 glycosyltransferase family 2 protein [Brevibacillus laterosporus]CCF16683.1 glycosyl transferase 2 family protein [Brevibacillus laterosporus GI-9]
MTPNLSIVILTRNGLPITKMCVESIQKHTKDYELICIDNGSTDGTVAYLNSLPHAVVISNGENRGFAAGNNQGFRKARGEYIVMLNNDTLVTPQWSELLINWLNKNSSLGMVGPRSNNVSPGQQISTEEIVELATVDSFAIDWTKRYANQGFYSRKLVGHCILFRRSLLEHIGGLDERFHPANYEDDDFCLRARLFGKNLWVANDVFIYHFGHASFLVNKVKYRDYSWENARRFIEKWQLPMSIHQLETQGYNPNLIVGRVGTFDPQKHVEPL